MTEGARLTCPPRGSVDEGRNNAVPSPRTTLAGGRQDELLLNLAQIHVRLGNLGRQNDNVRSCVKDYKLALLLRTGVLGRYDKKGGQLSPSKIKKGRAGSMRSSVTSRADPQEGGEERRAAMERRRR
jgi:hypothetical protein